MLAYTAWDGLQTIARQYEADLEYDAGDHPALAPRWARALLSVAFGLLAERLRAGTKSA